jgi:aspartate kinase
LDQGQIVIVAGFQGVSYRREVTTLGRGGSDTTAVALAAALDAEACEIYSDVDGVYTADPRVVPEARRLDAMSHDEMLAMARCGAKVLGSDAVAYARMHGIALYARSTHGGGETLVRRDEPTDRPQISGVASRAHCAVLQYDAEGQEQVETELANAAVAPLLLLAGAGPGGGGSHTLLLGRDVADAVDPAFERLIHKLRDLLGDRLRGEHHGTLVSIVGPAVGREPALLVQFRSVVTRVTDAPPAWVMAHGLCLSALLDPAQADTAVVALHRAFVEGGPWQPPAAA